jgi:hypothetical protein
VEFVCCDRFIVDSPAKAAAAEQQADARLLFEEKCAIVLLCREKAPISTTQIAPKPQRRVMYVSSSYPGEMTHLNPVLPTVMSVDWQARLFAEISAWGDTLIHKPHPEGAIRPPAALYEIPGCSQNSAPFEAVRGEADVLLFDSLSSTAFDFALRSDMPIVVAHFDRRRWLPEAALALKARCAVVEGAIDGQNRLQIDWQELRRAFDLAPALRADTTFRDRFLGS